MHWFKGHNPEKNQNNSLRNVHVLKHIFFFLRGGRGHSPCAQLSRAEQSRKELLEINFSIGRESVDEKLTRVFNSRRS